MGDDGCDELVVLGDGFWRICYADDENGVVVVMGVQLKVAQRIVGVDCVVDVGYLELWYNLVHDFVDLLMR